MLEIVSYRLSATGVWGYSFFRGREFIGETKCQIGRSNAVRIVGREIDWHSQFMIDTDIVPGISRRINDSLNVELYRIIYWRPGLYEFIARTETGEWSMRAEERNGMYLFGQSGMPVAAIMERISEADWVPSTGMQIEPAFRTLFPDGTDSPGFLMLVLSFPALKMI